MSADTGFCQRKQAKTIRTSILPWILPIFATILERRIALSRASISFWQRPCESPLRNGVIQKKHTDWSCSSALSRKSVRVDPKETGIWEAIKLRIVQRASGSGVPRVDYAVTQMIVVRIENILCSAYLRAIGPSGSLLAYNMQSTRSSIWLIHIWIRSFSIIVADLKRQACNSTVYPSTNKK